MTLLLLQISETWSCWYLYLSCDLGWVCSISKFLSFAVGKKQIWQASHSVLSNPKQCMDHFSSSYSGQTNMASIALFWLQKQYLCLFSYLNPLTPASTHPLLHLSIWHNFSYLTHWFIIPRDLSRFFLSFKYAPQTPFCWFS